MISLMALVKELWVYLNSLIQTCVSLFINYGRGYVPNQPLAATPLPFLGWLVTYPNLIVFPPGNNWGWSWGPSWSHIPGPLLLAAEITTLLNLLIALTGVPSGFLCNATKSKQCCK